MGTVFQFAVVLGFSFAGEILHELIPLPVPASVYGLVLLFMGLLTGIVKLSFVENAADILIKIMPMLFIPSVVRMMEIRSLLLENLIAIVLIVVLSTVVVMGVTGRVAQGMIRRKEKDRKTIPRHR